MKKGILSRYAKDEENNIIIEIAGARVEDLYDVFDHYAPYVRKELNQDLVDYIVDSVREIEKENFVILFNLTNKPEEGLQNRIKQSIKNYFLYLRELELRERRQEVHRSFLLLSIGIFLFLLSLWLSDFGTESTIRYVFVEGLTVASWVSMWEALATYLVNWHPRRKTVKMYERISICQIRFA